MKNHSDGSEGSGSWLALNQVLHFDSGLALRTNGGASEECRIAGIQGGFQGAKASRLFPDPWHHEIFPEFMGPWFPGFLVFLFNSFPFSALVFLSLLFLFNPRREDERRFVEAKDGG